jgi:hypothetical protein
MLLYPGYSEQEGPKVFGCEQIISLLGTKQSHDPTTHSADDV